MMRVSLGDHVRTSDDQDVGTVAWLLLHAPDGQVRAVVVHKGFLLHQDIEIPLSAFAAESGDTLRLTCTADMVAAFPRFEPDQYLPPPPDYVSPLGYPAGWLLWPGRAQDLLTPFPMDGDEPRALDEKEHAVIGAGSAVLSHDGAMIGHVHGVTCDPATGHPTCLLVRRGLLRTQDVELPAEAIAAVDDHVVQLTLDHHQVPTARGRDADQ